MADAYVAGEWLLLEPLLQRGELALGASAPEHSMINRGNARGVIAAVFEALERFDQMAGDRLASNDSDDPAHPDGWSPSSIFLL
jgi:hypothetical protein